MPGTYAYLLASRRGAEVLAGTPEAYDADNIAAERAKWSGDVQVAQDVIGGRAARNSRERALPASRVEIVEISPFIGMANP